MSKTNYNLEFEVKYTVIWLLRQNIIVFYLSNFPLSYFKLLLF